MIRSLGAAGYRVIASSDFHDALGFHSRYATERLVSPKSGARELFVEWLDSVIERYAVDLIIPSEDLVVALDKQLVRYLSCLPMTRDVDAVRDAFSKCRLFERFSAPECPPALRVHLPPYRLLDGGSPPPSAADLAALGPVVYLKTDGIHGLTPADDGEVQVVPLEAAPAAVQELAARYQRVLAQGDAPGVGTGVFFVRWAGRIVAEFMYRGLHESPHRGGDSTLRESWWHEQQYRDARARLEYLNWDGVYMFEYRWDAASDRFALIEVNSRFWMSLHLALYAGVDFPRLLVEAVRGRLPVEPARPTRHVVSRLIVPGEVSHVISRWRDPDLGAAAKLWSVLNFFALSLSPSVRSDLAWPSDRAVCWHAWRLWLRRLRDDG